MRKTSEEGFTLAFVAILIAVAGIVSATFLVSSSKEAHWQPIRDTQTQLEKIHQVLIAYQRANKSLPCPAPLNVNSAHANYGVAAVTCAGSVAVGAVPFKTLLLPESYGVDAWDTKITYVMTPILYTQAGYLANMGAITVETDSTTYTEAAYVLISHGKSGGGYPKNSTTRVATTLSNGIEEENWNTNATVLNISHNYEKTADYYDDIVIWAEVDKIAKVP